MTLKVVQGLVGKTSPETSANQNVEASRQAAQTISVTSTPPTQSVSNDAVITNIRATKGASTFLKIRDYEEAKDVAEEVADDIRTNATSLDAHNELSAHSARGHFAN